jgi:zinc ribbon protein
MSLISCPACSKQVSERAPACPHCGHPIAGPAPEAPQVIIHQQQAPRSQRGCGGGLVFLLLVVAGIVAAGTKPDEAAMMKAVVAKYGVGFGIGAAVGQAIGTAKYTYHDYFLFSTMTLQGIAGPERNIATGLFGQVIVSNL